MAPKYPLPLPEEWEDVDTYLDSLLAFSTSNQLFINLCGGVHILDFLTREPDLYSTLLPEDWRRFFDAHDVYDILHLLLREDLSTFDCSREDNDALDGTPSQTTWRNGPVPPRSLLEYIREVRRHTLRRDFVPQTKSSSSTHSAIPRRIGLGMTTKKRHEVEHFAKYVDSLTATVAEARGEPVTHIVDFGSGQNYLGRTLAASYNQNIIAIERQHANVSGAKDIDVKAKLAKKKVVIKRAKKSKRRIASEQQQEEECQACTPDTAPAPPQDEHSVFTVFSGINLDPSDIAPPPDRLSGRHSKKDDSEDEMPHGSMDYIEHEITDGYLEPIIRHVVEPPATEDSAEPNGQTVEVTTEEQQQGDEKPSKARVMVVSLHSCGNLVHHGVRSLVLNPSVIAVAMIGCCYNLVTERLGPPTYKLPELRSLHPRLVAESTAYDPHGFPMSKRLAEYPHPDGPGIRLNITARTMALQAPYNWVKEESEEFFKRHFYRAVLQRVFVDRGVVQRPTPASLDAFKRKQDGDGSDRSGTPLIVGSLRKAAYVNFASYAKAAMVKLSKDPVYGKAMMELHDSITTEELEKYEEDYQPARKNLSLVWSLMAFSGMVSEALIVVDRWQFLREHMESGLVKECWVESVFDYAESPRNLAVIGIKN